MKFEFTDLEVERYRKFTKKHYKKCQKYTGAIGVNCVEVVFTPTSMGDFVKVVCTECGKEKDITDMSKI
jgi:hypothetical protein